MKFEFTTQFKQDIYGRKAFQIRALIDFKTKEGFEIKKGDLGGFVCPEAKINNSEESLLWVFERGTIWGGTICGGTIKGGTICGGTIEGGTIEGGTIWGGTIKGGKDLFVAQSVGSEFGVLTVTRNDDGTLLVNKGCFTGTLAEFVIAVQKKHDNSLEAKKYGVLIDYIKLHFGIEE